MNVLWVLVIIRSFGTHTVKLFPHPHDCEPVGGVKWKEGLKGSLSQSMTASPSNFKEVASEKIVSDSFFASFGRDAVGDNFIW